MAPKRSSPEEEDKAGPSKLKRCRCKGMTSKKFCTRLISQLEPMIRTAVQDEVQKLQDEVQKLLNHVPPAPSVPRHPNNQIQELSRYQLHFGNTFNSTLFTGRAIENLQILIKDAGLDKIVTSGLFSSVKIKIVVLNGEFCGDGQADWTEEDFVRHILSARRGKPPLLTGELSVSLSNGVGDIVGATFYDNSSWTKEGFRLGAVVFDERVGDTIVRGAVSKPFTVKDRRGERNQKNCPPLLNSEVCNLKYIGKGGPFHKNLMTGGIKTVQDLLRSFVMNPNDLFNTSKMPRMKWEAALKHAFKCALGSQLYSFSYEEKGLLLIFNSILQLVGANRHGLYLPDSDLIDKEDLVNFAYRNATGIIPFHGKAFYRFPKPFPTLNATSMPGSTSQSSNFQVTSHDKSTEVGVQHQLYASCGEVSNDLSMRPYISHGQEVDSAHHFSSFPTSACIMLPDKEICASYFAPLSPAGGTSSLPSVLSETNLPSTQFVSQHQSGSQSADLSDHFQDISSGLGVQSYPSNQINYFDGFYVNNGEENVGFPTTASTKFEDPCTSYEEFVTLPTQVPKVPGGETGAGITSSSPSKLVHLTVVMWVSKIKRRMYFRDIERFFA